MTTRTLREMKMGYKSQLLEDCGDFISDIEDAEVCQLPDDDRRVRAFEQAKDELESELRRRAERAVPMTTKGRYDG